jgi:TolA-binding protein/antitoxin component of MazEF toxin-antitoxin module
MRSSRVRDLVRCSLGVIAVGVWPFTAGSADKKSSPGTTDTPAMASEKSSVKPAAERAIAAGVVGRAAQGRAATSATKASGKPFGPRIPEHLRKALEAQIGQRIERDIVAQKELRREAVGLLETFVKEEQPGAREMPEALMRLGELYWETEREELVMRFHEWEKRPTDQRGPAPEPNFDRARALFARVLKDYKWFESYDLALYVDGFLATEQGRQDEALDRFNRILANHPHSRFIPDAHMARAESAFNGKYDYAGALVEYEKVMQYPQSDLYGLALFKSAWCQWRLGRSDEAAKRFLQVFQVTDAGDGVSAVKRKQLDELQAEALKYLVEVFTEDDKNSADDVYGFLVKAGGDKFAGRIVKALAQAFYEQAHYERGIEAYELMLKLDPTGPDAPSYGLAIAQGYATLEDWPKLKATHERLLRTFVLPERGGEGGAWARAEPDADVVKAAQSRIEKQLREDATNLHGKAQRDKTSRAEFDGAAALYEVYLSRFGKADGAYEAEFNVGEIDFYHLGKNSEAATHYMATARRNPKGPLTHDALYNAISALERMRSAEFERKTKGESEVDKKFTEAMELYIQLYPNDPDIPELLFRQGKLYYDHQVYDAAVRQWGLLLEKFPNSKFAAGAGELTLDSFNQSKDYSNIEIWARRLKTAPSFQGADKQKRLDTLIVQSVFKQGEQLAAAGKHGESAAAYLRAAKEFPRDARAGQACVNAEIEAQKAGEIATMKSAADLLISEHKDAPEAAVGAWTAATQFQGMGLFAEAAGYHEVLAERFPKSDHAKDAAFNSVLLRTTVGDYDRAIQNGKRYRQQYGSGPEADEVAFLMGKAHEREKKWKDAADLYRNYAKGAKNADRRAESYVRLATVLLKMNAGREADDALAEAVGLAKQKGVSLGPDGRYAAAHARYMQGERILAAFEQIEIAGDMKKLSARLKQKAELLRQAAAVLLECVGMGVAEWTTAALYQIGHTYEAFAAALRKAPPPSNLSDSDKDAYQQQIDAFVVPIEEKSLEAYESGWKKAVELGIFNSWTAKMREALGRLNAELYAPAKEIGFDIRSSAPAALPPLIAAPRRGEGVEEVLSSKPKGSKK